MANLIYLTLNGDNQGLISSGCSSQPSIGNKAQTAHIDQIMIYEIHAWIKSRSKRQPSSFDNKKTYR